MTKDENNQIGYIKFLISRIKNLEEDKERLLNIIKQQRDYKKNLKQKSK